jgi:putative thioredoxin
MSLIGETAGTAPGNLIKDATDATFVADVLEASKVQPVIVDFWATWCGPCKTLGPMLEKAVTAAKGAVKLVKIDVDKNPSFAGQLRVQSIPAVFAFIDGRPVDAFMGAVPESQIKAFIDKLVAAANGGAGGHGSAEEIEALLAEGKAALAEGDVNGAAHAYAHILQHDPENAKAIAGMARIYLTTGDHERAAEVLAMAPEGAKDPELDSIRTALTLAAEAPAETSEHEKRLAADPADHEARFELAKSLAGAGHFNEAADHLLKIIEADRTWNDDAARKQLLTVFEAAGPSSDVARTGRRRLSTILFS